MSSSSKFVPTLLGLAFGTLAVGVSAAPVTYEIDPAHARIRKAH